MAHEFEIPFLGMVGLGNIADVGRAPIDPNFVLAIEKNQQNRVKVAEGGEMEIQTNGAIGGTIVDEYKNLVLCEIFKEIVEKLIQEDTELTS